MAGSKSAPSRFPWRRCRWGLAGAAIAAAAAALAREWLFIDRMRQEKVIFTMEVAGGAFFSLFIAWLLFSGRPLKRRLQVLLAFLGLAGIGAALFLYGYHGVTGDLVPVFDWRRGSWSKAHSNRPPAGSSSEEASKARSFSISPTDYPQFLGPNRNAALTGTKLARDWQTRPPRLLWRQPIGLGWSAFAVADGAALTQEQRGEEELVAAYDLLSGKMLWSHADPGRYRSVIAGDGPRATPTIAEGRVFTLGAAGRLNCLSWETGEAIWSKDILEGHAEKNNEWGKSCSPLLLEDRVVVSGGGPDGELLAAYHRDTGSVVWQCRAGHSSYSSPLLAELAGARQILILNGKSLTAHDPTTGALLWRHPWPGGHPKVSQPIPLPGDRVFLSSGYGVGCELIRVAKDGQGEFSTGSLWKNGNMKTKFTNAVVRSGFLYGLDDGILACLDLATGERKWKEGRYGHGQILLVEDLLVVQAESGEVALVEINSEALRELGRFPALSGKTWNNPAFSSPYLLVRNDCEAACYELQLE